jgi:CPA2 family monovalent cation:H+ antiporter-2
MDSFALLRDVVIALGAALTLGLLLARLGQSALVGFLLAGVLIGPYGLALVRNVGAIRTMAELGVALLLFTIGLELPWRRLRALGTRGAGAGVLQIVLTGSAATLIGRAVGIPLPASTALGLIIALSSTAVVFRVLADRAEIDSVSGRVTVGILLIQDIAVIPILLAVPFLAGVGAGSGAHWDLVLTLVRAVLLIAAIFIVSRTALRAFLHIAAGTRNRELLVMLAVTYCLAATWAADALGLSPILGAFAAGMVLAETNFANQVRADVGSLRAGFLALFFVSIGMLADTGLLAGNALPVAALILAIVAGKVLIAGMVVRSLGFATQTGVLTGLALGNIGELSFVVGEVALGHQVITPGLFNLLVSSSVVTLLLTPYLIGSAPRLAGLLSRGAPGRPRPTSAENGRSEEEPSGHVIVVGFGPTGSRVVSALEEVGTPYLVLELNPQAVREGRAAGMKIQFGDASHGEVLWEAGIRTAMALVVTVPEPRTAAAIVSAARTFRSDLPVLARARYARYSKLLAESGADAVLSEEDMMGTRLAATTLRLVGLVSEGVARVEGAPR